MGIELGHQQIMSHDDPFVDDPSEILGSRDRPKRPGEIEIDLTSIAEAIISATSSVNWGGHRIVNRVRREAGLLVHHTSAGISRLGHS